MVVATMRRLIPFAVVLAASAPLAAQAEGEEEPADAGAAVSTDSQDAPEAAEERPFLGLVVTEVEDAAFDGIQGLQVRRVIPDQTAAEMGLEEGDILQTFNGAELRTRADLSKALAQAEVGAEVTASWMRGEEAHSGQANLGSRPQRRDLRQRLQGARERLERLQAARANQLEDQAQVEQEQVALGSAMAQLATVLEALPEQMQQAADEFKAVYPDGEFEISVTISIKSNAEEDAQTIDLSPTAAGAPEDEADDAQGDEATPGAEEAEADDEGDAPPAGPLPPPAEEP